MRRFAVAVLLAIVGCASLEDRIVFHPRPIAVDVFAPPTPAADGIDVEFTTASDVKIHARLYGPAKPKNTILYCPGNAGNLESRVETVKQLSDRLGMEVLIFDYPGYGKSGGTPSEAGCYEAAEAAYDWLRRQAALHKMDINPVVFGESLGGAVAVDLASKKRHTALVLVRTFTSIPDVADYQMPLLLNSMLMHNRFDSISKIGKCPSPVFIAHADRDAMIPLRQGNQLKAACTAPSQLYLLRNMGHNDPLPDDFYFALRLFLAAGPRPTSPTVTVTPTVTPAVATSSTLSVPSPPTPPRPTP